MLVGTLEELLAALAAGATDDQHFGWLRPLAVLSAEIEYSAVRRAHGDLVSLAGACRELRELLACGPGVEAAFAVRYPRARAASPAIAALHDRILDGPLPFL